jgi:hypothetical protein
VQIKLREIASTDHAESVVMSEVGEYLSQQYAKFTKENIHTVDVIIKRDSDTIEISVKKWGTP